MYTVHFNIIFVIFQCEPQERIFMSRKKSRSSFLVHLGRFSAQHKRSILISWLIFLFFIGFFAIKLEKPMNSSYTIDGLQSIDTLHTIDHQFGTISGKIVFSDSKKGKLMASDKKRIMTLVDKLNKIPGVSTITNPFTIVSDANEKIDQAKQQAQNEAKKQVDAQISQEEQKSENKASAQVREQAQKEGLSQQKTLMLEEQAQNQAKAQIESQKITQEQVSEKEAISKVETQSQANLKSAKKAQSQFFSKNNQIGYIPIKFNNQATDGSSSKNSATQKALQKAVNEMKTSDLTIKMTSGLLTVSRSSSNPVIGQIIAFIILFITLGTLWAAGLPLVSSLVALFISQLAIRLITHFVSLNSMVPSLAMLIGLAVGIDYSLFIVNRYRQQLLLGDDPEIANTIACGTAGVSVFFSSLTVILGLVALSIVHIQFLTQMGLTAAGAVFIAMLASITLTPALLDFRKEKILSQSLRRHLRDNNKEESKKRGQSWVRHVVKHRIFYVVVSLILLCLLSLPLFNLRLGLPNDGIQPSNTQERQAFNLLSDGFGAGTNGPIVILATYDNKVDPSQITDLKNNIKKVPDVATVSVTGSKKKSVLLTIIPDKGPSDVSTRTLVSRLRKNSLPQQSLGKPNIKISGTTAIDIDVSNRLASILPEYLLFVVGFGFLLLLIVFRSIWVPLKAMICFLLSQGVVLGATVAVWQWGWLGMLFGVDPASPLLCFLPIMTIGVMFGLSMDYEIFLVSGMRERFIKGEKAQEAIISGFSLGNRVVTASALIMISVFGTGIYTSSQLTKPIAFAMAIGVLVDAFVVRMTLLPAIMALLDKQAWWFPKWLDKVVPHVDIEG